MVSWIFAVLLLGYSALRSAGWVRGQIRWRQVRHQFVGLRPPRSIHVLLSPEIRRVHSELDRLRARIAQRELEVRRASITDPDVSFGIVRSSRYRTSVRRISGILNAWLRTLESAACTHLEDLRSDTNALDTLTQNADWLTAEASTIARTRALEGFELERVEQAADVMLACRDAIFAWQVELEELSSLPYRRNAAELRRTEICPGLPTALSAS